MSCWQLPPCAPRPGWGFRVGVWVGVRVRGRELGLRFQSALGQVCVVWVLNCLPFNVRVRFRAQNLMRVRLRYHGYTPEATPRSAIMRTITRVD